MIVTSRNGQHDPLQTEAEISLKRLLPRLEAVWSEEETQNGLARDFTQRLIHEWPRLFRLLYTLYNGRYDFFYHLEEILFTAARGWKQRGDELREQDDHRRNDPTWFESERMVGGALYVDLFSENLSKLRECIPYFKELGLTYVHLMPLFAVRPGDNDGGYAISNYRSVDPRLGTIEDLQLLADELRAAGICLCLDFVFNHTSDDHYWAQHAQAGDVEYQQYYYCFPDRHMPDQYERTLREIFPTVRRGNFTWHDGMQKWVWTTFNSFQWDLNYHNPAVFRAMLEEMLFIANTGVDILRLDAVAFIWKQMGTNCENLPEAHLLIQAFNCLASIAAPGLVFKSEAIVHPDEVVKYIGANECQISYNPTLMALLWESLATRNTRLLKKSLSHRHKLPIGTAWVNYLRCHDDIGWTFDDDDAGQLGINGYDHRQFLNQFYTGQFPGSFARGVPFQHNPTTGDMRISGTLASLAGLEQAIEFHDPKLIEMSVRRMCLLYGITLSIGGIPLLYLGEEWGMLNDYDFVKDPAKAGDTRWIHRPKMKWEYLQDFQQDVDEQNGGAIRGKIFRKIQRLISLRKKLPSLAGQGMDLVPIDNPHVLGFVRHNEGNRTLILANFTEESQRVPANNIRTGGLGRFFQDLISDEEIATHDDLIMQPYGLLWLERI